MAEAPGAPGIEPRWTSSDKSGLGTALRVASRVWFTISHGILNECYYPRVDQACTRDFGFIVTDGAGFFAEEKRDTDSAITALSDGVPAYQVVNTHRPANGGRARFRIVKRVITDPRRDTVLQSVRLEPLDGSKLRLFALLAPHLVNAGSDNTGWLGDYKGQQMLFAEGGGAALALASDARWRARSVGFAGVNDGWQDLHRNFQLTEVFDRAAHGNIAITGEIALPPNNTAVFALGFGRTAQEAAFRARASLLDDFAELASEYAEAWRLWQATLRPLDRPAADQLTTGHNTYRVSTSVLRTHEAPSFRGGYIASLSIPWGASKGDDDLGGYHLVWPRDLVQTAGGLLAAGAKAEALRVLEYLRVIQEPDGHWPQNNWLDGTAYWQGLQMDECAFPILLVDLAWREGALPEAGLARYWPMVRAAAGFIAANGPATGQDRWEENAGFSVFTLAVEIAALLVGAEMATRAGQPAIASFLTDTADAWNARVESWTYAQGTQLAQELGIDGYYVRMGPCFAPSAETNLDADVQVKNRAGGRGLFRAHDIISTDALALVRFGLRSAKDPRILGTVRAIDARTRVELPAGPCWYRYTGDGYGEHTDGRPFDGTGHGRLWPLLTGERAHVAIAAGDLAQAHDLLGTLEACTSRGALLPEQVWDAEDIPERELFHGRPSGSAMPLVWAHAEHIKLLRSLAEESVFDMPPQTVRRYQADPHPPRVTPWRVGFQTAQLAAGTSLRIELARPSVVRWSNDSWANLAEIETVDTGLGIHVAEIAWANRGAGLEFNWRDAQTEAWDGHNYRVDVLF
jgi:glucoamylase